MQIPWHTGLIESQGELIYYESSGSDALPALLFCHGGAGNHAMWFRQVPFFATHYRVITWDQRGFGNSSKRSKNATPEAAFADLVALLDALGIESARIVGQSMGGWPALALAVRRPERAAALVLASSLGGIPIPQWVARRRLPRESRLPRKSQPILGEHPAFAEAFCEQHPEEVFLYQQLSRWGRAPGEKAPASTIEGMSDMTFGDEALKAIQCPVLFVAGDDDDIFPLEWIRLAAQRVPHAKVEVIEGAGHSPYFEAPLAWNRRVAGFLAGCELQ
jgi:pimeloyl-ACP methyl ester carboxylesterase